MYTVLLFFSSDKKRSRGNDLYSRGDYAGAIDTYKRGLRYLGGRKEKVNYCLVIQQAKLQKNQLKERVLT